jgi:hypothetical protein
MVPFPASDRLADAEPVGAPLDAPGVAASGGLAGPPFALATAVGEGRSGVAGEQPARRTIATRQVAAIAVLKRRRPLHAVITDRYADHAPARCMLSSTLPGPAARGARHSAARPTGGL